MPQFYKRKTERCERTQKEKLMMAAKECDNGQSIRKAALMFGLDKMTLYRYLKKVESHGQECIVGYDAVSQSHYILPPKMEKDLAAHIQLLADNYHGLTLIKCKELAYEFAIRNNIKVPNSWQNDKKAGRGWWLGFKSRQNLSIRTPEATSLGRASAFNKHNVGVYFNNLAMVFDKYKFEARQIFNLDETGVTTVQNPSRIVAAKGTKQVGSITSAERGQLVTVVYAICGNGSVIPPMFIFPRKNYRDHFIHGGPQGSIGKAAPSGWINEKLFIEYLSHFAVHTQCSKENMVLLILDNHESHISLAAVDKCRELGIVLLSIPPHTSHRLQPLDKSVFGPFKHAYNIAMDSWIRSNPGKTVSIYNIPQLVAEAQLNAMVPRNILSGFQCTGNWPYNPNVFTDLDFAPSNITDRMMAQVDSSDLAPESNAENVIEQVNEEDLESVDPAIGTGNDCGLTESRSTSARKTLTPVSVVSDNLPTSYISPSDIVSIPKAPPRKENQRSKRRGKTQIFTLTPVRNQLKEKESLKKTKRQPQKSSTVKKQLFKKRKFRREKEVHDTSSDEESLDSRHICCDDESDVSLSDDEICIKMGDFVIVKVSITNSMCLVLFLAFALGVLYTH